LSSTEVHIYLLLLSVTSSYDKHEPQDMWANPFKRVDMVDKV